MLSAHERSVCGIFLFSGSHINRDKNTYGNIQLIIYIPPSLVKGTCELNEKNIGHMLLREGTRCNFCLDYGLHGNKVDSSAIKLARLVSLRQVMQISCLECLEVSLTISLKRSCWMLPFINLFASNRPVFLSKLTAVKSYFQMSLHKSNIILLNTYLKEIHLLSLLQRNSLQVPLQSISSDSSPQSSSPSHTKL